jgi:geranylgeranyl transferase type-1 subunit beta
MISTMSFDHERHVAYFSSSLRHLPRGYCKLDTNRLTLVHFAIHALDLLSVWDMSDEERRERHSLDREGIIDWIYSLQTTGHDADTEEEMKRGGFIGGSFLGHPSPMQYDFGHLAMTYTALASLRTLGDDLSRVNKHEIILSLRHLQLKDGSFQCVATGSEHDMRFLYCACSICHMLQDWSTFDARKAVQYIQSCHSWDGAFALLPGQEGHGGSTFCAVASLVLMGKDTEVLDNELEWRDDLIRWCTSRQVKGMQGRPAKLEDTCYSYWIGGTLRLLGQDALLDHSHLRSFVLRCQTEVGGFGKAVGVFPDVLHSFYSMAYLSLSQQFFPEGDRADIHLKKLNCTLGFCQERVDLFGSTTFP